MTERDRTERSGMMHIRTLLANTSEGFVVVGADGLVKVLNETAETLLDVERAQCVGRSYTTVGNELLSRALREALHDRPSSPESIVISVGERTLTCRIAAYDDGAGGGLATVLRDDSALLEQQERAEAILAGTGDGLIVFTPDSRVTYVNPSAIELLGPAATESIGRRVPLAEILGMEIPSSGDAVPCWEMLDCGTLDCPQRASDDLRCWLRCGTPGPDGAPLSYRDKRERCAKCSVRAHNAPLLDEPGVNDAAEVTLSEPEHRVLEVRTNPVIEPSGRYIGCVTTLHDVTAAREIAIMKNEFVSMVSHELRTPLTSIKGYVDLIIDGEAGEINDIQREFLGIVQENSDRLVSLINDLLDISRIESGRVHLRIEPVDVCDVVDGVVDTFRTVAEQSGVELAVDMDRSLPRIAADRDRLGQVLMNFVSNAIKYSPDGGSVRLTARRSENMVRVEIADEGIGISDEDQAKLFEKFYRVDSTLTREIGGTGLGLSICKSVVELMGGEVWVESTLGQGSTFGFSAPVAPQDLVRTPAVEGPLQVCGGTVLVVDRTPDVADLIETYLRRRGYDVMQAHSVGEARRLAEQVLPCLITLDVTLDDGDGFDLLQEFKENPKLSQVPVVVLSVVCDERKSLRLGAADYLEKPIEKGRLVKIVDDLVGANASPVVLIVDDDRSIVESLGHTLRARGFAVATAFNGREAMSAVEAQPPDLILLDLKMPVMDGYQVIQEVRGSDATKDIPIVVMTAHRIDHSRVDVLNLASDQVAKPFTADDLAERIDQVLAGEA